MEKNQHDNLFNHLIVELGEDSYRLVPYRQKRMIDGVLLFDTIKGSPCTYYHNYDRRRCVVRCNENCIGHITLKSSLKELLFVTTNDLRYTN